MKITTFSAFVLAAIVFCFSAIVSVHAQTGVLLTVNSNGDTNDAVPGDRYCADAAGRCTLRAAVEEANTNSNFSAIIFDLPMHNTGLHHQRRHVDARRHGTRTGESR